MAKVSRNQDETCTETQHPTVLADLKRAFCHLPVGHGAWLLSWVIGPGASQTSPWVIGRGLRDVKDGYANQGAGEKDPVKLMRKRVRTLAWRMANSRVPRSGEQPESHRRRLDGLSLPENQINSRSLSFSPENWE